MKQLTLFRHAKTERVSSSGRDFDRVLTDRGKSDAARMGEEIRRLRFRFDLVLSSPAARASDTAELAGLAVSTYDQRIYEASVADLLAIARAVDDDVTRLIMIGHNPGFERLASALIGEDIEMPTGSLVEIELPIEQWRTADRGAGRLLRFLTPKALA
jgi:phosphohistidine phosphatase